MEETPLESLFRQPLRLVEDIEFGGEVDIYQQECRELLLHVGTLTSCLRNAVRMVRQDNSRFCEHPTRRIIDETSRSLEVCCFLIRKCRKGGLLKRLFTITTAAEIKKANASVKDAIANVDWLLNSVTDEEVVSIMGMPPITSAFPNLSVLWSLLSKLQGGNQELREASAIDLALMTSANEQNGQFIIAEGGVPLLLKALQDGTLQCKVMAATALRNLAVSPGQVREMVQQGVIPACVHILAQGARQVQVKVIWALAEMVVQDQETQTLVGDTKAIMHLVALMLETVDDEYRSSNLTPLQVLVKVSIPSLREATDAEAIGSLGVSSSDCSSTGSMCDKGKGLDHGIDICDTRADEPGSSHVQEKVDEVKNDMQVQVTRALCLLAANNLNNSRRITETRAMLCLSKLIELAQGEVQRNAVMTIMELATVAEENADFRKFAFKLTSPAARTVVNQLHHLIIDDSVDPNVQVCCIRAVGSLAKAFSAKENKMIKALVLKLSNLDRQHLPVAIEAINALLKFTDKENYLCQKHCLAILEVPGLPFLVQMVALDRQKSAQFPAIRLLSQLALCVGRTCGEAFQEAAALSVLKSVKSSDSTLRKYAEFSSEDDISQAIYHLKFCGADSKDH